MRLEELTSTAYRAFAGGPFGSNLKSTDYTSEGVPVIQLSNITEDYLDFANRLIFTSIEKANELKASNAYPNEIIIAKMMPAGRACISTDCFERYVLGSDGIRVSVDSSKADLEYVKAQINSKRIKEYIAQRTSGSTRMRIGIPELKGLPMYVPPVNEQRKIGSFLKLLQKRIQTQNKIIEQLKSLKTSIIDRHFSKPSNRNVGQHIVWASERNKAVVVTDVYSMSNSRGFVPQTEQFEDRIISSDDVSSYKIVRNGCFVYNPARINVGSIALYSRPVPCIVSPMYNCFFVEGIEPGYLCAFFQSKQFKKELQNKLEGSVRRCLTPEGMNQIHFFLASEKERVLLIEAVYSIEKKICIECKMLSALQKQKGYLLSNMFL